MITLKEPFQTRIYGTLPNFVSVTKSLFPFRKHESARTWHSLRNSTFSVKSTSDTPEFDVSRAVVQPSFRSQPWKQKIDTSDPVIISTREQRSFRLEIANRVCKRE